MRRVAPYLFLLATCVLFFWKFVFLGEIPIDSGPLYQMRPWSRSHEVVRVDSARQYHNIDPIVEVLPIKTWMIEQMRRGEIPLWTPEIFSGAPFAANHHAAPWDFSTSLFLLFPGDIAFGLTLLLQLFAAGASTFLLCRALEYSYRSSLIAATAFLFNSFFFHWLGMISFNAGLIWMPLIPAGIEFAVRRNSIRSIWPAAMGLGLTFLSGMGQFWLFQVILFIAYGGYRYLIAEKRKRIAAALVLAGLLGIGLGAAQLLQTVGALQYTSRGGTAAQSAVYEGRNHLSPRRLPTLLIPDLFGHHEENVFSKLILKAEYPESHGFIGRLIFGEKGSVFNRIWGYVGIPALLLGIAGFVTARRPVSFFRWLSAGVLAFQILLCWTAFHDLCVKLWPGFDTLDHTRTIMLYVLGISVLAAEGTERLSALSAKYLFRISAAAAVLLIFLTIALWMFPRAVDLSNRVNEASFSSNVYSQQFFQDAGPKIEQGFRDSAGILIFPVCILAAFAAITGAMAAGKIQIVKGSYLILLVSIVDLAAHGWIDPPLSYSLRKDLYPAPGGVVHFLQNDPEMFRVYELHRKLPVPVLPLTHYSDLQRMRRSTIRFFDLESVEFVLRPDTLMRYNIESAGGYMSLYPGRYKRLWQGRGMDVLTALKSEQNLDSWNAPWIGMLNVKYVLAPEEYSTMSSWKPVFKAEGISVLKVDSFLPRIFAVPRARVIPDPDQLLAEIRSPNFQPMHEALLQEAPETAYANETVEYKISNVHQTSDSLNFSAQLSNDAYVMISSNYFPWWRARVDGYPVKILPANLALQCIPLSKGTHEVHMDFQPPYYKISLLVSLTSACCLLLVGISLTFHARKETDRRTPVL